jgi:hypothetical protein
MGGLLQRRCEAERAYVRLIEVAVLQVDITSKILAASAKMTGLVRGLADKSSQVILQM